VTETIFRRHSLGDLADPWLRKSLRAWYRICDTKGRFHLGKSMDPIFRNPGLLLPASTVFLVDGEKPEDFVVLNQGPQATQGLRKNMTGCRLGDYFDRAYVETSAAEFGRAVAQPEVVYDEVVAYIAGRLFHYDRLLYPILWRGQVDQLLTVVRWRSPNYH
jgi:hypothetical protein